MDLSKYSREELEQWLNDAAKLWLAHDGLWFQSIEKKRDMEEAIEHDTNAWARFSPIEAKRIMNRLNIQPGGGIQALRKCLFARLYTLLNDQELVEESDTHLVFQMSTCRVQDARKRYGLNDFPCKPVGLVEYQTFAETVDPRIKVNCIACPPDEHPDNWYCKWEFKLEEISE
ncbi:MAG: hypothetical protein GY752_06305 [bacterium]|nr:hypothetical protein [bacterium]MCP4798437.1 hypothetical protein [bacterium]